MAIEREIEFKQLLDADSYVSIKTQHFKGQTPFKQVNYYIDTVDFQIQSQKWHCVFVKRLTVLLN